MPKYDKNLLVTSYRLALLPVSCLPQFLINFLSSKFEIILSTETPLILSISDFVIGCLYAIIDKVSI